MSFLSLMCSEMLFMMVHDCFLETNWALAGHLLPRDDTKAIEDRAKGQVRSYRFESIRRHFRLQRRAAVGGRGGAGGSQPVEMVLSISRRDDKYQRRQAKRPFSRVFRARAVSPSTRSIGQSVATTRLLERAATKLSLSKVADECVACSREVGPCKHGHVQKDSTLYDIVNVVGSSSLLKTNSGLSDAYGMTRWILVQWSLSNT